ncbi:pentatricopeptide repeat-containing protein At5g27110-like [Salvia miltiorrhiza]|uniref:pentatricopeptide repeat-containing protein At5g27110-like n=1 Tax=Salvia miltiorrhiza TaxID=226208 RepID=UPI0025AC1F08|nr:pentatricopeptide repeat-containing protein At5g27110-like [Salvia miltiorrhiza]
MFNLSLHQNSPFAVRFLSLLPFCRKSQELKALNSILISRGLIGNESLVDHFINHCCRLGSPDLALPAFRIVQKPSLYSQNLLLRSLCDNGLFEDVVSVYKKSRNSGSPSNNYSFPFVIKACAALRDVWFGSMMYCVALKDGFGGNLVVQTALLDFYFKIGEIGNARKVLDEIPQPDLVVWNAMISGYSVNGFDCEALRVFRDMFVAGMKPNSSTLATVLPVCSRVEEVDRRFGVCLHGLVYKLGCIEEESLAPALISMYSNCGDLSAAEEIFDASTRRDVVVWNAMISAYTRSHAPRKAAALFRRILVDEIKPNMVTFVSLLPSCENIGSVESFHAHVFRFGYDREASVVTALVSVYAKLGEMDSAEFLFRDTKVRSLLLWNSMVSAHAGHGFCEQSLELFRLMQADGFDPDAISIVSLLKSCSQLEAAMLGKSAHAFVIRRGIDSNLSLLNAFLAFYFDSSEMVCCFRIFDRMALKSVVTWNTMISGCIDEGELERAMLLFHHMRQEGCKFDMVTLISILPSCHVYSRGSLLGSTIHGYAIRTALASDVSLGNALVSMYINCGELDAARLFFDDMPQKSVVSWNAILTGYRLYNLQKDAIELFHDMIEEDDQMPSCVTLLNVLPACEALHQGKSVHGYIIRRVMIPLETPLLTSLMIMYARFKNLKSCLVMFHFGDKTSISVWNAVISANLLMEDGNTALSFFCELLHSRVEPDEITIHNLISACLHLKNLNISNSIMAYLVKEGFDRDVALGNSLIDMYAKTGSISSAGVLFDSLPHKDNVSWSVMINGCGLHGHGEEALSLYTQMRLLGLKPDRIMYMSVLSACSHAGSVEQGRMVFNTMIHEGMLPGREHYACMVDLLGRAGRLDEAYEIVKNQPCGSLVASLLGACLSHGNYELGEEVGRFLLDLKPKDSAPYVILYNIYAAAGKWADANDVRLLLGRNQLAKAPGISLVC